MKRLKYLDYIKTPNEWKTKALDISNQIEHRKTKHHRGYKPSVMLIASIVVLSISGIGVFATENGMLDKAKEFFENNSHQPIYVANDDNNEEVISEKVSSDLNDNVINSIQDNTIELSDAYDIQNDTKVEVLGYTTDNSVMHIYGQIIATEDTNLHLGDNSLVFEMANVNINNSSRGGYCVNGHITFNDDNELPQNVRTFTYTISYSGNFELSMISGIYFGNLCYGDLRYGNQTYIMKDVVWNIDLDLSNVESNSIELVNEPIIFDYDYNGVTKNLTLNSCTISPFSINFEIEEDYIYQATIVMKDGTSLTYDKGQPFTTPLDFNAIDYILIGGQKLYLPQ